MAHNLKLFFSYMSNTYNFNQEKIMKLKNLLLILILGVFPSFAFSYSCPMKISDVNQAISELDITKHGAIIEAAKMLRTKRKEAHKNGDHQLSEDILATALRLLDV